MNADKDMTPEEGAAFLENLDLALAGRAAEGPHTETAQFGAAVARTVSPAGNERADPILRRRVEQNLNHSPVGTAKVMGSMQAWMQRWKIGVLDLAALVIIGVLSVALLRSWLEKPPDAGKSRPAIADGDAEKKDEKPAPAPESQEAVELADTEDPAERKIHQQLAKKVSFEFVEQSLADCVNFLNGKTKVNIIIDPRITAQGGDRTPITLRVDDMELEASLRWVLSLAGLEYDLRNQAVFITSRDSARRRISTEVYSVDGTHIPVDAVARLIGEKLYVAEFQHSDTSAKQLNGMLVVCQTPDMHRKISHLLAEMRRNAPAKEYNPISVSKSELEWIEGIKAKFKKKLTFDFVDTSFDEAVAFIRRSANFTIIVDPKVQAAGIPNLNLHVTEMQTDLALDWIMKLTGLEYSLKDHGLYITMPENIVKPVELRIYDVADLTKGGVNEDRIEVVIRSTVQPDSWDASTGASIELAGNKLIVMQRPDVHATIHQVLSKLRGGKYAEPAAAANTPGKLP